MRSVSIFQERATAGRGSKFPGVSRPTEFQRGSSKASEGQLGENQDREGAGANMELTYLGFLECNEKLLKGCKQVSEMCLKDLSWVRGIVGGKDLHTADQGLIQQHNVMFS